MATGFAKSSARGKGTFPLLRARATVRARDGQRGREKEGAKGGEVRLAEGKGKPRSSENGGFKRGDERAA